MPRLTPTRTLPLILSVSLFLGSLQIRKLRNPLMFTIALLSLLSFTICISLPRSQAILPIQALPDRGIPAIDQHPVILERPENSRLSAATESKLHKKLRVEGQQVKMDSTQELAAVSSFLASLAQNMIPLSVDPSVAIDPQLVLDFDTRSTRAAAEVQQMVKEFWSRNPVFLYSKVYSSASREIKDILAKMNLQPIPTIIDVDIRDDAEVLAPLISRLTSLSDLPVLLIGGKPTGSVEDIRNLVTNGELHKLVRASGAIINGSRKKWHSH